jgi:Aconitase C-terminal domain
MTLRLRRSARVRFGPSGIAGPAPPCVCPAGCASARTRGCGSSREHAVWGLLEYGIRAVVAASFAEIFYSNAMNNRLMLVTLTRDEIARAMTDAADPSRNHVSIDVARPTGRCVHPGHGDRSVSRHEASRFKGQPGPGLTILICTRECSRGGCPSTH